MASGLGAVLGVYRAILLCMALAIACGLYAGWVQPLFIGGDVPILWGRRLLALWAVSTVAFWPTANSCADRVAMSACMLVISALLCLAGWTVIKIPL